MTKQHYSENGLPVICHILTKQEVYTWKNKLKHKPRSSNAYL